MPTGSLAKPNGRWVHDHLLSLTLFTLFLVSWIGQLIFQYQHELDEAIQHGDQAFSVFSAEFMHSFWASTLENWQSEFLQLLSFVVLTTFLIHRHSHESRDSQDEMAEHIREIKERLGERQGRP
jgi:DNA-binding GntR family transcriptional regulator